MRERLERHPLAHLAVLYLGCIVIFLVSVPLPRVDGQLVGSDGTYYYAYLPSLLIDHDLDFSNQYRRLMPQLSANSSPPLPDGTTNKFAVGAALLWFPFFLLGHGIALILNASGFSTVPDGMGFAYQIPTLLGSITYGFVGVVLVYRICHRFFSPLSSALAAILIWLATSLIYYMTAEPSMSHACSFFAVALFLELWLRFRPLPDLRQWVLLGITAGIVALVRLQDATWLVLPCMDSLLALRKSRNVGWRRQLGGICCFGAAAWVTFLPQMVIWQILNGSIVRPGYVHAHEGFFWLAPKTLKVLFSLCHGLYSWHPILLFATAGLVLLYRKNRLLPALLGLMFAVQIYVIGSWHAWSGGDAFGGRMLISSLPALALGLAALVDWAAERRAMPIVVSLSLILVVWNALLLAQYRFRYISQGAAVNLDDMTLGKLSMLQDIVSRIHAMLR